MQNCGDGRLLSTLQGWLSSSLRASLPLVPPTCCSTVNTMNFLSKTRVLPLTLASASHWTHQEKEVGNRWSRGGGRRGGLDLSRSSLPTPDSSQGKLLRVEVKLECQHGSVCVADLHSIVLKSKQC